MRAVISQNVDWNAARGERRDMLDHAWGPSLDALVGSTVALLPLPNRPEAAQYTLMQWNPQLVILSGGNDIGQYPERDATESIMLRHAIDAELPVLAVCRGMQMAQHFLGGSLESVENHVACTHIVRATSNSAGPATLNVNSYHRKGIRSSELATDLQPLYLHDDDTVEAARHTHYSWLAVMWHPERTTLGDPSTNEWIASWLQGILK